MQLELTVFLVRVGHKHNARTQRLHATKRFFIQDMRSRHSRVLTLQPTHAHARAGALTYLEPVAMSILGTDAIDVAAAAEDAAMSNAACDDGRRRVRFNMPADDDLQVIRPSDHYGLMARFELRWVGNSVLLPLAVGRSALTRSQLDPNSPYLRPSELQHVQTTQTAQKLVRSRM